MKTIRLAVSLALLLTASATLAQTAAQRSFASLKTLAGSWEGKNSKGEALKVSFRDTAGGSALMSEIEATKGDMGREDMISMIHFDGPERSVMTHYCTAGNQPRLVAEASPDGKQFTFNFFDGTGMNDSPRGHMQRVVISLLDENHHIEEWSFAGGGKEVKEVFDLHRKL